MYKHKWNYTGRVSNNTKTYQCPYCQTMRFAEEGDYHYLTPDAQWTTNQPSCNYRPVTTSKWFWIILVLILLIWIIKFII